MTTLLYISPQFPVNFRNFVCRAAERAVTVLGIATDEYWSLPEDLRGALREYWKISDVNNYEEILWAAKELSLRHGGIDIIESQTEFWFLTEGKLRDALGVAGFSEKETFELQRKSHMKEIFTKAGVAVVPGKVVHCISEAEEFLDGQRSDGQQGAVVLKPDRGVGATNTFKVTHKEEFQHFSSILEAGTFIEKFIEGDMLTFDGLVDSKGEIVYWTSFRYSKPVMELVANDDMVYYYTARTIPADVEAAGRAYLQQIQLRSRFFHLEFFRAADGTLYGLEANLRPPGGPTVDLWNYADNIDLYDGWAQLIAGQKFSYQWSRDQHVCYVGRKYGRDFKLQHHQVLELLGDMLLTHEPMSDLFRDAMGDYCYIFKTRNEAAVHTLAKYIHALA